MTTPRKSRVITFSMPPEMAEQVRQLMQEEGRTMSELIREALRLYMDDREWRSLLRYGQRRAREWESPRRMWSGSWKSTGPAGIPGLKTHRRPEGGYTDERATRLYARGPLRPGLQRPPGRGPLRGRPAAGAPRPRRQERLLRGPRVRGRGRERQDRRPPPVPQDDRRGQQAGGPVQGNPCMEVFEIHQEAGARRGLQGPVAAQGHPRGVHHRAGRGQRHRQAA